MMRAISVVKVLIASLVGLAITWSVEPPVIQDLKIDVVLVSNLPLLRSSLETCKERIGFYPESLSVLADKSLQCHELRYVPIDPWGNDYVYRKIGAGYELYSRGFNGIDEGMFGDDVVSDRSKNYSCAEYGKNCPIKLTKIAEITALVGIALSLLALVLIGILKTLRLLRVWYAAK